MCGHKVCIAAKNCVFIISYELKLWLNTNSQTRLEIFMRMHHLSAWLAQDQLHIDQKFRPICFTEAWLASKHTSLSPRTSDFKRKYFLAWLSLHRHPSSTIFVSLGTIEKEKCETYYRITRHCLGCSNSAGQYRFLNTAKGWEIMAERVQLVIKEISLG